MPVKLLEPDSVSVPPATVSPPVPPMLPENVPAAFDRVSIWLPSVTAPAPVTLVTVAPEVVAEMSNVPASATPEDAAMLPLPVSAKVAPAAIVVAPV